MSEEWQPDYNRSGRDEKDELRQRFRRVRHTRPAPWRYVGTDPLGYLDEDRDENPGD